MSDAINPLNLDIDVSGVDTTYPSLNPGTVPMRITESTIEAWKKDPTKHSWVLKLETIEPALSASGEDLKPGFKQSFRLNLQAAEYNGEIIDHLKPLTLAVEAIFGERRRINPETFAAAIGRVVDCVIKKRKNADDGFGETEIKSLKLHV